MTEQVERRVGARPNRLGTALKAQRAVQPDLAWSILESVTFPDDPALLCDDDIVVRANSAAADLLATESAEVLAGARVVDLIAGEWAGGGQARLRRPDGTELSVRIVRCPLPSSTAELLMLVDISELTDAANRLREEQRWLTEVQEVAGLGSWEYDPATDETVWSVNHYAILGLEPGSVRPGAQAMLDLTHPDDVDMVARYWREHKITGDPIKLAWRIIRPDGEVRRIQGVARCRRDETGQISRITGYVRDITQQWRVETELGEERMRLLEAQRISRMGSWTFDVEGGVTYLSEALKEILPGGGEISSDDLLSPVHPEDRPRVLHLQQELYKAPHGEVGDIEIRDVTGERSYMCRARAERGPSGKVERLQGTVQDVTEQRFLERQLREERRRLDDAQRVARLGTWEWDPVTNDGAWSSTLHELYGVPLDERATCQTYLSLVHPEDRPWVEDLWKQLAADHQPVECEHRLIRRDGAVRIIRCLGAAMSGPDNKTILVGTAQDVTEQRTAETRMERSSQRFADLVSVTPVGIGIFDDTERLVDANDALCELLGYDLEQLRGMAAEHLTHPEDRAEHRRASASITSSEQKSYKISQRILLRADGEPVYCELHVAVSVQDDGRRFWLVVFQDITERRRAAEALRYQATHDELTGLPNRAAVKVLLRDLLSGDDAPGVGVLFCDIDNFKRVNDSLGHDAGDELLVALARRLEGGLPKGCTAARLSGDEYVIICADLDAVGGVDALATKVASLLRTVVPVHGQLVRVSASIGAAMPNGSRATGEDLLRFADAAMFEAKRRGAGRVSLASAALMASADRQVHLEGQLREALTRDGLALHYQPVVAVDGSVLTAEALVRWPHPDRGLLAPDVFLPVAEQGDLLRDLDRWVLRTALKEAAGWPMPDGRPVAVAVNLAGLVPGDPDFVDAVANAVAESGIEWDRVVLELVETALVDLPSKTRQAMGVLVERGVRFAVDDFGTGYSSLARLKELPAQIIKVDRRFVSGVGSDASDFAVARAVVDMARAMGRSCVAEGVETATQFHVLHGVGVDAYQGWLFSRPVPPKEFRAVLELGSLHVPKAG